MTERMVCSPRASGGCGVGNGSGKERQARVYVPAYHMPHNTAEEAGVRALQGRRHDAGVDAVSRYALAVKAVVQGARVGDGGDFGVAVTFPGEELEGGWHGLGT